MTDRIRNLTSSTRCKTCGDDALVPVSLRKTPHGNGMLEYGPCPDCERGYKAEFPQHLRGCWGPDGYWRGRDPEPILEAIT